MSNKKELQKPLTLEILGQFAEEVLFPVLATKDDLESLEKRMDKKIEDLKEVTVTKDTFKEEFNNFSAGLSGEIVTKDYLDKKLNKLQELIESGVIKDRNKLKEVILLIIEAIKKIPGKQTKKQTQTLDFLKQELATI